MRTLLVGAALLAACSSDPPVASHDAADDLTADATPDVADVPVDLAPDVDPRPLYPRCEETGDTPDPTHAPSTLVATIRAMVPGVTAGDPSISPDTESGELMYRARLFDRYGSGPMFARTRRNDLREAVADGTRRSLAWFVHLSDFQLVDDESPARAAVTDSPAINGGLRPQEALVGHVVSAFNRTLGALERRERPYDFGIITGDCADSAQLNELRWVIQVMDGARDVRIDSGERNDLVAGPANDPKDPFDAVAFPAPWLYVAGNHDVEVVGNFIPTTFNRATATGTRPTLGTRDYRRRWGAVTTADVPADPDRRLTDRADIVRELCASMVTTPGPVGHGFPAAPNVSLGANYAYDAVPGLLRVLSLDTSDPAGGSQGTVKRATVDRWLVPELDRAERDGVLVMLASHHATTSIEAFVGLSTTEVDRDAVPAAELERLVTARPQVIAWLVGHEHAHRVRAVRGADAAHPGYWEIMTGAIADWPAQVRMIELVDNGNGTLSILGTLVDYEAANCLERRFRRLALLDFQAGWGETDRTTDGDRNVDLVVPVPAGAMARVAARAMAAPARLESETTLRGM